MKTKPSIQNLTIICVAGNKQAQSLASLYKAKNEVDAARFLFLTNIDITATGIECINVGGLDTWERYNHFIIKELYKYFETDYCLLVQWDGILLDGQLWSEDFIKYDYIGASWLNGECGNGGFSARSHRLMKAVAQDDFIEITAPEDNCLCILYKNYLIKKYGITYAPKEVCDRFSFELNEPLFKTFGKHAFHWPEYRETVVIRRSHALGDVLRAEPILHYFHKKGYQVALETSDENMAYFKNHFYRIVPRQHLNPNLPVRVIDLNMAYEVKPQQNHLKSYYDFAEVPEEERIYRNPILCLNFDFRSPQFKLFKKYCVIHVDERTELHRNLYGIDWAKVVKFLNDNGYVVVQVGGGKHEQIEGAIEMKTPWPDMLMWAIASSDLFIGIDSGPSHVASSFNVPSVILSGSVDMNIIHSNLINKLWIHKHDEKVCDTPFCWHREIGQSAPPCPVNPTKPPCVQFDTGNVISKISHFLTTKTPIHTEDARNIR